MRLLILLSDTLVLRDPPTQITVTSARSLHAARSLKFVMPGREVTEAAIDFCMTKATELMTYSLRIAGDKNGFVTRSAVRETIVRYRDYLKEQDYIDKVFVRHDSAPRLSRRCGASR